MIKKTRSIISISFFLLLLTCSGMEKGHISFKDGILSPLDNINNKYIVLSKGQRLNKTTKPIKYANLNKPREKQLKSENKENNSLPLKSYILLILDKIDENNNHILSNGYRLNETEDLVKYADLNHQRKKELASEEENCNPLTVPALIMLNKCMREELSKHLPPKNKHVVIHQRLLEILESLKK